MYIAYSALQADSQQKAPTQTEPQNNELLLRYQAYQSTCQKYHHEITAIQQYLPGWTPAFK
ncbi:hypothetical protein [Mucilaginibacter sp.]